MVVCTSSNRNHAAIGGTKSTQLLGQPLWMSEQSYGLIVLFFSAFFYSIMACFVKLAVASGVPSSELVFVRALLQGILVAGAMMCFRCDDGKILLFQPFGSPGIRRVVVARGIVGGIGFLLYYFTVSVLPLGDAVTLLSLNPVITVLAASVFLKEPIRTSHVLAAAASVIGSVLLTRPTFLFGHGPGADDTTNATESSQYMLGYLSAFLGTSCGAAVFIFIRRAGTQGVHTLQLLLSWSFFGFIYSTVVGVVLPLARGSDKSTFVLPPTPKSGLFLAGVCFFGICAHFCLNYAARHSPAGLSSIMRSSGILWSYALEVVVFHQVPQQSTMLGVSFILTSLLAIAVDKQKHEANGKVSKVFTKTFTGLEVSSVATIHRHPDGAHPSQFEECTGLLLKLADSENSVGYCSTERADRKGFLL